PTLFRPPTHDHDLLCAPSDRAVPRRRIAYDICQAERPRGTKGEGDARRRHDPGERGRPPGRTARPLRGAAAVPLRGPGAAGGADRGRLGRLGLQRPDDPQHRAQRRRRPPQGGVRHRADGVRRDAARVLGRPRAGQGHERRGHPRLDVLPVVPVLLGAGVRRGGEWRGAPPGRFIPMGVVPLWDPELAAAEVRRLAAKGVHSITSTENPATLDLPSFHSDSWDPLWAACCDEGVVVSIHLGSSGKLAVTAPDAPVDVMITLQPMNICHAAADLLWSRIPKHFPDIRIALSEGGTGWIPYFLDRLDRTYEMHHRWTGQDFGGRKPSEVFRQHFLTCFIADEVGIRLRHDIGVGNIAWECDYPHSDSSWPGAPEELAAVMADVP